LPAGPWSNQGASGTTNTAANPMQSLASDIQAMLLQAQGASAAVSGTGTAGGTTAITPEQQAATNLQTLMSDLQAGTSTSPNAQTQTQTASANPAAPTGQTEPHHHHHHHGGGGEGGDALAAAGSSTASGSTATTTSSSTSDDGQVSQVFAADIAQALQAYSGTSATTTMPSLTV
jgi:hypothetical protein